jgi:hypothetical protein
MQRAVRLCVDRTAINKRAPPQRLLHPALPTPQAGRALPLSKGSKQDTARPQNVTMAKASDGWLSGPCDRVKLSEIGCIAKGSCSEYVWFWQPRPPSWQPGKKGLSRPLSPILLRARRSARLLGRRASSPNGSAVLVHANSWPVSVRLYNS